MILSSGQKKISSKLVSILETWVIKSCCHWVSTLVKSLTHKGTGFLCTQGWQESVDAAVTHLLRTTLAKSSKDQTLNPQPLHIPEDTTKVKKHLALMCDKLGKGARLVEGLPTNSMGKAHSL